MVWACNREQRMLTFGGVILAKGIAMTDGSQWFLRAETLDL